MKKNKGREVHWKEGQKKRKMKKKNEEIVKKK
jgi:hypothetical protein